jgi:hypothetical protein
MSGNERAHPAARARDLFGSGDFPPEILLDPAHAADVAIQQLNDAGFAIKPAE